MWGNPKKDPKTRQLILGVSETTFPHDGKWTMMGDTDHPFYFSDLGVKQITKSLTQKISKGHRPNSEARWDREYGTLPWEKHIWPSLGTDGITNPTDEKSSHKLLLRKLAVDNNDSRTPTNNCRICKNHVGSMSHHLICSGMEQPKQFATQLLLKVGVKRNSIHPSLTWLTCLNKKGKPLPNIAKAIIRLFRRVNYRHFVQVVTDKHAYNPDHVISDLARTLMARILSVQYGLQKFIISRRHTPLKKVLPPSINNQKKLGGIGKIDIHTGVLKIKKGLKRILINQEVWRDIYSKKKT